MLKATSTPSALRASAPIFAALGDETRLSIVRKLCVEGPTSIVGLSEGSGITRQAITKHLHVLAEAGLVRSKRHGRMSVWEFTPRRLDDARRALDAISREWDDALERLKQLVET
jgi:DNA-binding transcriptional ArsR family regulator